MFKKTFFAVATFTSLGAQAVPIQSITITGGDFSFGAPGAGACSTDPSDFSSFKCITPGPGNTFNAGDGTGSKIDGAPITPTVTQFNFFGQPVSSGLFASAAGVSNAHDWDQGFQGDVSGGVITLNLGGFYWNWNGTNFSGGTDSTGANGTSTAATGTIDGSGNFDITWRRYQTEAPCAGQTSYWHLTGTATMVPEASTYGMMLAGLGLVGFVVGRRRRRGHELG